MSSNKNFYFFIALIFPFLPIIFFLNKTNFPQLFLTEIVDIIIFQLLVFFFFNILFYIYL